MINRALTLIANEPVLAIAAVLSAVLAVFGVVIDVTTLQVVITAAVPALGAALQRGLVTPVAKLRGAVEDVEEVADEILDNAEAVALTSPDIKTDA